MTANNVQSGSVVKTVGKAAGPKISLQTLSELAVPAVVLAIVVA